MTGLPISQALSAYGKAAQIADGMAKLPVPLAGDDGGNASSATGFGDMLAKSLGDAKSTAYGTEAMSMKAIAKKASPVDLVAAINNADLTLQTVVAVRDRVIAAYQDIVKMPI